VNWCGELEPALGDAGLIFGGTGPDGDWIVPAALAGADSATNAAEKPTRHAAASSAAATVLRDRPGRGASHSRAAPTR